MSTPEASNLKEVTTVFATLGDAKRLQLVQRLGVGEARSIVQLAVGLGMTHQGVTKHLKVLEHAGLVRGEKVGRERHFICEPDALNSAQAYLDEIARQWDAALLRLTHLVE